MPDLTPGAQRITLADRVRAFIKPPQAPPPIDGPPSAGPPQARQGQDLTAAPFGPGQPIEPQPLRADERPRQFQYTVGSNLSLRPRGEFTNLTLTPFEQLRQLARFYDVASICIETRINWLTSARWAVVAKDKKRQAALQAQCQAVEAFFRKPDRITPFPAWLRLLMLDQLEVDALTIYKQRDLAGRLLALQPIDGTTIKPLLDERGRTAAYQQILYGYVRGEYDRPGAQPIDKWAVGGDLVYAPRWISTDSPYGRSPTEQIILRVNTAIRKQTFDLAHFTDGNVPVGLMAPPQGVSMQPEQVRQFEDAFNADLAGDDRARNRIKFMPWDGKLIETKPFSYDTAIDQFLLEVACASYHVPKNELGMTDKVNKASSQEQEDVAFRHAIEPDASWLKTVVLDPIIHEDLGQPDLEWDWLFGKAEDQAAKAETEQADVKAGIISATESRRRRYPDLDGDAPGPPAAPGGGGAAQPLGALGKSWRGWAPPQALEQHLAKGGRTGAIVALMVPPAAGRALIRSIDSLIDSDPEPLEDLHITLAYLGSIDDPKLAGNYFHALQAIDEVASRMPPITGRLNGIGRFDTDEGDGTNAIWAAFDAPALPHWRQELIEALGALSVPVAADHGFTPHITLAYVPQDVTTPTVALPSAPLTFGALTLCWGDDRQAWPLTGRQVAKADGVAAPSGGPGETITTETGLLNNNLATRAKRKRTRGKRRPVDVDALIESQAAGALEWAKKASEASHGDR